MIKKTEIELYIEDTLSELLEAAKEGIATLIADVKRPIADDVADERRKNALESKKKAFMDAQEGETINEINIKDNHFKGGAAEKFAK